MTSEDLLPSFELPFADFSKPIKWRDDLGFSITQSHGDGYGSLYKFGIYNRDAEKNLRELFVSVSYGKETADGLSLGTGKNGVWNPLDLDFFNEFFYDSEQKKFFHYGVETTGKDILLSVEKIHKKPSRAVQGLILRNRLLFWRILVPGLIKIVDAILIFLLWLISGEKLQKDIWKRIFSKQFPEHTTSQITLKNASFENHGTIDFFGYEAKRWSVVFYCALQLSAYIFYFYSDFKINILSNVLRNSFLAICYAVITFAITESFIPSALKSTILKFNPMVFNRAISKKIKVS